MEAKRKRVYMIFFMFLGIFFIPSSVFGAEEVDTDSDGLLDQDEIHLFGTNPKEADTDGDGFLDGEEIKNGYSPYEKEKKRLSDLDSDKDYLNDSWEVKLGTGLKNPDTDGDRYLDGTEVAASYDPKERGGAKREKKIEVDLSQQELVYFFGEKELERFLISGGIFGWPTPKGDFQVTQKLREKIYNGPGYRFPNTKWNLLFAKKNGWNYWIHGAYWHNSFGTPRSHGCVNVSYENMELLYQWAQVGTRVHIF